MGEGDHRARLKFEGDASGADKAAKQAAAAVAKLEKRIESLEKRNKTAAKSTTKLEEGLEKASRTFSRVTNVLGAAGLVGAAVGAVKTLDTLAERSVKIGAVMGNLPFPIDAAKKSTMGLVDSMTLATAAGNAARLGVTDNSQAFADLASAATKLGMSVGQDAAKSVSDLTTALARQSPMILDNLGINLKLSTSYDLYAKRLGKNVSELNEVQKKQAFVVEGLAAAKKAADEVSISTNNMATTWKKTKVALVDFLELEVLGADASKKKADVLNELAAKMVDNERAVANGTMTRLEATRSIQDIAQASTEYGFTQSDLNRKMAEYNGALMPRTITLLDELEQKWIANTEAVDDFSAATQAMALAMGQPGSADGGVFGGSIAASLMAGSAAMNSSRRIGVKEGKKKKGGKKKKAEFDPMSTADPRRIDRSEFTDIGEAAVAQQQAVQAAELANLIDFEERKNRITLEKRLQGLDEQRSRGLDPLTLIDQEEEARLAFVDGEIKRADQIEDTHERKMTLMELEHEREGVMHAARLQRIEAEKQAELDRFKTLETIAKITSATAQSTAMIVGKAASMGIMSQRRAGAITATIAGIEATVLSFRDAGRAASAYASYNFPQAALYTISAATNATMAGLSFAEAAKLGGGGGRSGGGRSSSIGPIRGNFGGGSGGTGGGSGGLAPSGKVPQTGGAKDSGQQQQGGGTVININGNVAGSVDKDFILKVTKGQRDLERERKLA